MPRIAIVDACFPTGRGIGVAALWLAYKARQLGAEVVQLADAEVILVTTVCAQQHKIVERFKKKYNKPIIVGGDGALTPAIFSKADAVCLGDGSSVLSTLVAGGLSKVKELPNVWVPGQKEEAVVDGGFPWNAPFIQSEDGAYQVWCGRGCKVRCAFCSTGWTLQWSEHPDSACLIERVKKLKQRGAKFSYLTNDLFQHSFCTELPPVIHGSYTLMGIRRNGAPLARQVRLGIEGVSSRLRSAVGKPISHEDLWRSAVWLVSQKKSVRWFLLAGLPGETAADWLELRDAVCAFIRATRKGVLALSFTAWIPMPSTPLATSPLDDDYYERWLDFKRWFFERGWSNRVKLMCPRKPAGRLEAATAGMALDSAALYRGGLVGPNEKVTYPYRKKVKRKREQYWAALNLQ